MSGADDMLNAVQKVFGDKPLFLLAGASDFVNEKLRELPDALNTLQSEYKEFPMKAAGALVGQAFRANLKVGELYDDLTRRGEEVVAKMRGETVVAEEDEPFVREPFMPEPVRPVAPPVVQPPKAPAKTTATAKAVEKKPAANKAAKAAAKKGVAKPAAARKVTAKRAGTAKTATKKNAGTKAAAKQPTTRRSRPTAGTP
jgi:hypothetical protein